MRNNTLKKYCLADDFIGGAGGKRLTTRILMADDHSIVRKALRILLGTEKDFEVVGEASDGLSAVDLARQLQPDVLILDLMMPGMNGLEVCACLSGSYPQLRIIILSMQGSEAYIRESFLNGASAYVLKEDAPNELITAIRQVKEGSNYFSSSLPVHSVADLQKK